MFNCDISGVKWEDLIWRIEMSFPDIPEEVLAQAIRDSASRFLRESRVLRRWIEIEPQKGVGDYPIELEDCYMPMQILDVRLVEKKCQVVMVESSDDDCPCGVAAEPQEPCACDCRCENDPPSEQRYHPSDVALKYDNNCGCEGKYWFDNGWLNLKPAPDCNVDEIRIFLSMAPTIKSCEMPIEIGEEYGTIIAKGAKVELLKMKDEDWYNPQEAAAIQREFSGLAANASARAYNRSRKSRQVRRREDYGRGTSQCGGMCR